jgi:signal transduction histidine kinase
MDEKDIIKGLRAKISRLEKEAGLYRQIQKANEALDQKLSSVQNLLASVVDGNPIPTFILDQHHKVLYWNQTLEAISGISARDIVGTVFWNILKNGAEAMQEKKGPARFYLRIYQSVNSVNVEIEDNGPGMDKDTRKRIFEPFFTTKGKEKGTGLGLAVSYFIIVKDHGGKIRIESQKGLGTKFIVQFGV